jgi:hypothetical protein
MTRVPWGFAMGTNGILIAGKSSAERFHRAELGEAAIRALGALGIALETLEELIDVDQSDEIIAKLQEKQT